MIGRSTLLALLWVTLSVAPLSSTNLPPQLLPVYGGSGGTAFTRSCGAGHVLTGLRYRQGLFIDAIGILCRPVLSDGTLGPESTFETLTGGGGGNSGSASCSRGQVIVTGRINFASWVNEIGVGCRSWNAAFRKFTGPDVQSFTIGQGGPGTIETCEANTQPATGIRGRSANLVDALGFICDEP